MPIRYPAAILRRDLLIRVLSDPGLSTSCLLSGQLSSEITLRGDLRTDPTFTASNNGTLTVKVKKENSYLNTTQRQEGNFLLITHFCQNGYAHLSCV